MSACTLPPKTPRKVRVITLPSRLRCSASSTIARAMVDDALQRSREGNVITRTFRGVFGGRVHADIPVEATYSHAAVAGLVKRVEHGVNRPPRDATLDFSTGE